MKTKQFCKTIIIFIFAAGLAACSVVSKDIRQKALTDIPFKTLAAQPEQYVGQTVVLGGYILDVSNRSQETHLTVLQAPLDFQDEPKARDMSKGRFLVVTDEFLDPMVYEKGRKVTVAGTVLGRETEKIDAYEYSMPKIRSMELHLWDKPEYRYYYYDPYYPFTDNYYHFWWHHPYRW
jgi:outer membrane lipoprotein